MAPIALAIKLATYAPSLMRFFGAGEKPAAAAQRVVDLAKSVTGAATPEAAADALQENPELAAKFRLAALEADTELEKAYLADRAGARGRDIEVRKLSGGTNMRADLMVVLDVVGLVSCLLVILFFREDMPGEAVGIISTVAGVFAACLRDAHQFEFGSSRGSKEKDAALVKWVDET